LLASQISLFDFLHFAPDLLVQITNLVVRYSTERPDHQQAQTAKENPLSTLMQLSKKALIHLFIGSAIDRKLQVECKNHTTVFTISPQAKTFVFPSTRKFASTFKWSRSSRRLESSESRNHEDPTRFPMHTKWASALIVRPLFVV
jgi:hypothetical protein